MTINSVGGTGAGASLLSQEYFGEEGGADVASKVGMMMLEHARTTRGAAQGARQAEEKHLREYEAQEVAQLHEEADDVRRAASARAMSQMFSGLCTMAGGIINICGAASASSDASAARELSGAGQDALAGDMAQKSADSLKYTAGASAALDGTGKITAAMGESAAGEFDGDAKDHSAQATASRHRSSQSERRLEDIKKSADDARELTRTVLDFVRGMNDAEASANRAAIYQRA